MILRRLNEKGLGEFSLFLDSLVGDDPSETPKTLLEDHGMSDPLEILIDIEPQDFDTRYKAAEYLFNALSTLDNSEVERDKGLWAWLSLFFFEKLCTVDTSGLRKPGARAKWIPETGDFRRYYRHLLAGPYLIYRAHRDNPKRALVLLCGRLDRPGEIVEQLASRQEIITNQAIIETATKLYIDTKTGQPKTGAAGKGGGSARRFAEILNQFDVTWDLSVMESEDILNMLPKEFDKFWD